MFGDKAGANDRIRIKICGITNLADARLAIACGADALGFNFYRGSKRYIDINLQNDWLATLPTDICKVAVLVNPTWAEATNLARRPFIDVLQLHGQEAPEFCQRLAQHRIRFIKALPVRGTKVLHASDDFFTDTVLLDSMSQRGFGGTGQVFPWSAGSEFIRTHPGLKVILAGGLTPDNVAEAVETVRPFGVDVTSGVEGPSGRKDPVRLRAFFAALYRA
jgi:phosphoribosylanthranilate isomerase